MHLRYASVNSISFSSEYSYSMIVKLDRINMYYLYPCDGIYKNQNYDNIQIQVDPERVSI